VKEFDGEKYIMERGLFADLAIVHAWKGDTAGNLIYRKTRAQFQSDDGDRGESHGGRGRASGGRPANSIPTRSIRPAFRQTHRSKSAPATSASNSATPGHVPAA